MFAARPAGMAAKRESNRAQGPEASAHSKWVTEMADQIYKCRELVDENGIKCKPANGNHTKECGRAKIKVSGIRWVCPPQCPNCSMSESERRMYSNAPSGPITPRMPSGVERDYPPHPTA